MPKAGWRGATRENTLHGSSTEEQRSQAAFGATTLRAAGLLAVDCVGSVVTARCGDAPPSPPYPHPKSLAAAPLPVCSQALKLAQVALSYGADDLHGTIIEEHIFHMAGATSPQLQTEADMIKAIREAGRTPVQRNTFYEPIRVLENAPAANEAEPPSGKSKVLEDNLATTKSISCSSAGGF